jgi:hypothetical protein
MQVPMPLNAIIIELYQMMRARGMGAMEMNNVVPFVAGLGNIDIFKGGKKT